MLPPVALLSFLAATALHAQLSSVLPSDLHLTPPIVVATPRLTATRSFDRFAGVVATDSGFRAYYYRDTKQELRTFEIAPDGKPDFATEHAVAVTDALRSQLQIKRTAGGARLFWLDGDRNVRFSSTTADGSITDPSGRILVSGANEYGVDCNDRACLVQWWPHTFEDSSVATIVTANGDMVVTRALPPGVALTGGVDPDGFLLAGTSPLLRTMHVKNDGTDDGFAATLQSGGKIASVTADFDGERYAVAWSNASAAPADYATYASRIAHDGTSSAPVMIADEPGRTAPRDVSLAWNGSAHVYLRIEAGEAPARTDVVGAGAISVQLFRGNFVPLAPKRVFWSGPDLSPIPLALAVHETEAFIGWTDVLMTNADFPRLRGAAVDAGGTIREVAPFVPAPAPLTASAVAATADTTLAVFDEYVLRGDGPPYRHEFVRFTRDGRAVDATPVEFARRSVAGFSVRTAVLGTDVLVVWGERVDRNDPIQAVIVHTSDGTFDQLDLPIRAGNAAISAAASDTAWLIASGQQFILLSRSGFLMTPQPVPFSASSVGEVSAASDGRNFLIAGTGISLGSTWRGVGPTRMTIVNGDGTIVLPETPLQTPALTLVATFAGGGYLVASSPGPGGAMSRISRAGVVERTTEIAGYGFPLALLPFDDGVLLLGWGAQRRTADGTWSDPEFSWRPPGFRWTAVPARPRTLICFGESPRDGQPTRLVLQELFVSGFRRAVGRR